MGVVCAFRSCFTDTPLDRDRDTLRRDFAAYGAARIVAALLSFYQA
jgi:hypothetical protein